MSITSNLSRARRRRKHLKISIRSMKWHLLEKLRKKRPSDFSFGLVKIKIKQ